MWWKFALLFSSSSSREGIKMEKINFSFFSPLTFLFLRFPFPFSRPQQWYSRPQIMLEEGKKDISRNFRNPLVYVICQFVCRSVCLLADTSENETEKRSPWLILILFSFDGLFLFFLSLVIFMENAFDDIFLFTHHPKLPFYLNPSLLVIGFSKYVRLENENEREREYQQWKNNIHFSFGKNVYFVKGAHNLWIWNDSIKKAFLLFCHPYSFHPNRSKDRRKSLKRNWREMCFVHSSVCAVFEIFIFELEGEKEKEKKKTSNYGWYGYRVYGAVLIKHWNFRSFLKCCCQVFKETNFFLY